MTNNDGTPFRRAFFKYSSASDLNASPVEKQDAVTIRSERSYNYSQNMTGQLSKKDLEASLGIDIPYSQCQCCILPSKIDFRANLLPVNLNNIN